MTGRLALFDCDGTLADSQHEIVTAMEEAYRRCGLPPPARRDIRAIIGLSIPVAVARLAPTLDAAQQEQLGEWYRTLYFQHRTAADARPEPLYDGIVETLDALEADGWILGIATGKSRRGLVRLLEAHGQRHRFATLQTADFHPSKPDPSMALAALSETGVDAAHTVVIGDTSFDIMMARAAGTHAVGVAWGYHDRAELDAAGAHAYVEQPADLPRALQMLMEKPQ